MKAQNIYAIGAMCAIVITCYALRNSEAHYLPDLLALALALAAPRQGLAIAAVIILAIVRHSGLAIGLAAGMPAWLMPIVLPGARNMSIAGEDIEAAESAYKALISKENDSDEMVEISQPVGENTQEMITLGETIALARLVAREAIGLTIAVKVGAGATSGAKYQKRSKEIKAEVERQRQHYPELTKEKTRK